MNFLEMLEFEERVGHLWHRLIEAPSSWPDHPEAAVGLEALRPSLAVFFRGLGGPGGLQLASASARQSDHRLTLRQRIGLERERLTTARRDGAAISLPARIALFPQQELNRALYFWLAAWFALDEEAPIAAPDPLRRDLARIERAVRVAERVRADFPGLAKEYDRLARATLAARPHRRLPPVEARVEAQVAAVLRGEPREPLRETCPSGYRPFLPVPLWGEVLSDRPASPPRDSDEEGEGGGSEADPARREAERREAEQSERDDPLLLNRFDKILALAEMVNVNRDIDDSDEEEAKKAAAEQDSMALSQHSRKAATRLKFDLDLPPEATDPARLTGEWLYPEWDYRRGAYHPDHCAVSTALASEQGESWVPDAVLHRRIRAVRRQFEALRSQAVALPARPDGGDLDMDAAVRSRVDLRARGEGSSNIWIERQTQTRDLAVMLLVDTSLSTDSWCGGKRVLDVEKEALTVFCHGLDACGDDLAVQSFTSRSRRFVRLESIKSFDEPFGPRVQARIGALRPGYYTRIGAAIRHAGAQLGERPNRHRLLLVLTDGKPNDIDTYEGRYGLEDSRKALADLRAKGIAAFGITIDRKAQDYFPHLFGRGAFAIVHDLGHLAAALPRIYRHLA